MPFLFGVQAFWAAGISTDYKKVKNEKAIGNQRKLQKESSIFS
jgi:hypothetical protein